MVPPRRTAPRMYQGRKAGTFGASAARLRAATLQVLGADDAVDESDREVQAVGVLQHAGELLGRGVDGYLCGFGEPVADQLDGVVGEVGGLRTGETCGLHRCLLEDVGHGCISPFNVIALPVKDQYGTRLGEEKAIFSDR